MFRNRLLYLIFSVFSILLFLAAVGSLHTVQGQSAVHQAKKDTISADADSIHRKKVAASEAAGYPNSAMYLTDKGALSEVNMDAVSNLPYLGINQMLVGRATGIDVRTPSAEPAKRNSLFIRGTASLLLSQKDLLNSQPLYIVDGVPLILEHPFAYDIQRFHFNRLGTETDLLSFINVNDIQSIKVLKDFAATAKYGPSAANGVVSITTKSPVVGKMKVTVNAYVQALLHPEVKVVNAEWERDFRFPFYSKYAGIKEYGNYPVYLSDSASVNYYGPANWDELYYSNGFGDGLQASASGGNELASFRFSLGQLSQDGVADKTGMNRYNVSFGINIIPFNNFRVTTFVQAATLKRKRNHSLKSIMGDEDYIFNLENPPSPNKASFRKFYKDLEGSIDNNKNNSVRLLANIQYDFFRHFTVNARLGIDYNQNFRQLFIPSSLSDGNNFISDFDGINRMLVLDNSINYANTFSEKHHLSVSVGQYDQWSKWRYDFGKAYKGYNDYIKIYAPGTISNHQGTSNDFRLTFNYKDYTSANLASFYANIDYDFFNKYFLSLYLRNDGSSNVSRGHRWMFSPTVAAKWRLSEEAFLKHSDVVTSWDLRASWGKIGKMVMNEYYKGGPFYNVDAGWDGTPNISTYNSYPVLNAPFGTGYVPSGTEWPYVTQTNIGTDVSLFNSRLNLKADVYEKIDHNLLLKVPVTEEYGYTGIVKNGLSVKNYGYEVEIQGTVVDKPEFNWMSSLSLFSNKNKLLALPNGLDQIVIDDHLFKVGQPIDQYWVYVNRGIYNTDAEIPKKPATNEPMDYHGFSLQAGDPNWEDINKDGAITSADKILKGSLSPTVKGGFFNAFHYKNLSFSALFTYAFGREVINQALANRFDFANREGKTAPEAIKDVTFWQIVPGDFASIPRYNPWSKVNPYQSDQTLFLEKASYIKLRSATLSYSFHTKWMEKANIELLRVYVTGNHLWSWTNYSGGDPEAVDYFGYDQGAYNWSFPRSFTLGFNFQF